MIVITYSKRRKPTNVQLKSLYRHAPWAMRRGAAGIQKMLKSLDIFCAAYRGRELVGFCRCSTDGSFRAVLWDVIVDPGLRRQGVGARLVKSVVNDRRLKTVDQFWLYTTDQQSFYQGLGFRAYHGHVMLLRKAGIFSRRKP